MKFVCVCLGGRQRKYTIQIMIEKAENGIKTVDLLNTWFGHMKFINDRHHRSKTLLNTQPELQVPRQQVRF